MDEGDIELRKLRQHKGANQWAQRRRERGRKTQAAFRKRQAKAAQNIRKENQELRDALKSIVQSIRPGDRDELVSVIAQAAQAAGVEIDSPKTTTTTIAASATTTTYGQDSSSIEESFPAESELVSNDGGGSESSSLRHHRGSAPLSRPPATRAAQPWDSRNAAFAVPRGSVASVNALMSFGFGAWMNPMRHMRITATPDGIIPYVGLKQYTLASRLFWAVLEHVTVPCRAHAHEVLDLEADMCRPCFRRMMGDCEPLRGLTPRFIVAIAESRLQYRRVGYMSGDYGGAADSDILTIMAAAARRDYAARGQDLNVWLSPHAVEGWFVATLGAGALRRLYDATVSPESSAAHRLYMATIEEMVAHYVCFGDGPRWNVTVVNRVFTDWAHAATKTGGSLTSPDSISPNGQ
ncbi:hypothetical protein BX600DRAFT_441047 [Xylariales sp. PMI_506]|nr:hypothetical protein BX600DRAFT_441047 [Xylariales sp. PMI_506]